MQRQEMRGERVVEERAEGNERYEAAGNGRGRVVKQERRETRGMQWQEMRGERVVEERAEGNERYEAAGNERGEGSGRKSGGKLEVCSGRKWEGRG